MGGRAGLLRQIDTIFNSGALGHLPDAELLRRFVSAVGEDAERSFEALVDRHGPMVLGVCRRFLRDPADAQDAFQATFLVLSRKAGRVGRPERLASWLYGVASRTAMKARVGIARRRKHERMRALSVAEGHQTDDDDEIRAVLHEEIARLPEKYRAPVVLCHLEGMTRERASAYLRCPEGTVGVRLMRARERLRAGLSRRGFAVAAGALALDLGGEAKAALPPSLAASTASAAAAFASGRTANGTVSSRALTLTRRVLRTMFIERHLLTAPALLLAGALAAGVALLAKPARGPQPATAPRPAPAVRAADSPWKKELPGGVTVELIGVASAGDGPTTWWTPSGAPLADTPFEGMNSTVTLDGPARQRLFAIRVSAPPEIRDGDLAIKWDVPGSRAMSFGNPRAGARPVAPGVRGALVYLPEGPDAGRIRIGLGTKPWDVLATSDGRGVMGMGTQDGGVVFSSARAIPTGTTIAIAEDIRAKEVRVIALDRDGGEHTPATRGVVSARSARMHDLEFPLLPDQVREFRVLARPYEWAEFRDVALDPVRSPAKP